MLNNFPAEIISNSNEYRVEKLNSDGDGGIDVTIFSGPDAEKRAVEYAEWKYSK